MTSTSKHFCRWCKKRWRGGLIDYRIHLESCEEWLKHLYKMLSEA